MTSEICPVCGQVLKPSKKNPEFLLCSNCKKRYKIPVQTLNKPQPNLTQENKSVETPNEEILCSNCGCKNEVGTCFCATCGTDLTSKKTTKQETNSNESHNNIIEETDSSNAFNNNSTSSLNEKNNLEKAKNNYSSIANALEMICIIFILIGIFMIGLGFYKMMVYENYDSYVLESINAYVGGDAYNIIINAIYFAGYSVLGIGSLIISTITGIASYYFSTKA